MLEGIDEVGWAKLSHAYGKAGDVPELLRGVAAGSADALFKLGASICHQGTLFAVTARVEIYKRTQLPLRCYACGGSDFDYVSWLCACGSDLYHPANSMAALVWKR